MGNIVLIAVLVIAYLFVVGSCIASFLRKEEELEQLEGAKPGLPGSRSLEAPLAGVVPEKLSPPGRRAAERRLMVRERGAAGRPTAGSMLEGPSVRQPAGPGTGMTRWPSARRAAASVTNG